MAGGAAPTHGVMEGEGAYNRHARIQAGGATLAFPLLEEAVQKIECNARDGALVIADYGSSQGKNSQAPMRLAIETFRRRVGKTHPIFVYHVDQPANDFNSLFSVLGSDPARYTLDESNVFPCAIGRSFYEDVFPPSHVHLGWCSYAAVWLSRIPMAISGHFVVLGARDDVRAAWDRQGAADWEAFLSLRARELRSGGRLVVVLPGLDDEGISGLENLFNQANDTLSEMVDELAIQPEEREQIVLGAYPRRRCDLLAAFARIGEFQDLTVERCELAACEDPAWAGYRLNGNSEALAHKQALFFRATFLPSLASALPSLQGAPELRAFGDRLEYGLKRRLAGNPQPVHTFVETMVLAKR